MPQQPNIAAVNNFSKGFLTEYTGLNYPEDAVTDTRNCIFNRIGNVERRLGIDYEINKTLTTIDRTGVAISDYMWKNVNGDGSTQLVVLQVGATLYFYRSSSATAVSPLSDNKLASTVDISSFTVSGSSFTTTKECQYTDGNGYLFVFHPDCEPFYVSYSAGVLTGFPISVNIRDFTGILESGVADNFRPPTLSATHQYNLQNQGWSTSATWSATSTTSNNTNTGSHTWTVQTGLSGISGGQFVTIVSNASDHGTIITESGTVTSYNSGSGALVINVTSTSQAGLNPNGWSISLANTGKISTWNSANSNYPSNADVWWSFKDSTGVFSPSTTTSNVTLNTGPAPKGYYILQAFYQDRAAVSGVPGPVVVSTTVRPNTGCWFAGRIFYTGVNVSGFTENIYFSQVIQTTDQFGKCYQINDPTSEDLFDLLPTDGGLIHIQGCGAIYKLFPIQNGLLIFSANGVWFLTGSQGIGFSANDYTLTKISAIQSISATSFVDNQGLPIWWNEEGIYTLTTQQGVQYGPSRGAVGQVGLMVEPLTFTTIDSFYANIPLDSKKYVRGTFDYLNWQVRWTYRTTQESSVTDRYQFDGILTLNTATNAFSPWTVSSITASPWIHGAIFVQSPGGSTGPEPAIKYITSVANSGSYQFTFSEELDDTYVDWNTYGDQNFTSYYVAGYRIHGQAIHKFQSNYLELYLNNIVNCSYKIQGVWDYAINRNSNKYTSTEAITITDDPDNFSVVFKRHRIRGRGFALQYKITSVDGEPFDILGWSVDERINTGV